MLCHMIAHKHYLIFLYINDISSLSCKAHYFLIYPISPRFHKVLCSFVHGKLTCDHNMHYYIIYFLDTFMFICIYLKCMYSEMWSVQVWNIFSGEAHMFLYVYSRWPMLVLYIYGCLSFTYAHKIGNIVSFTRFASNHIQGLG